MKILFFTLSVDPPWDWTIRWAIPWAKSTEYNELAELDKSALKYPESGSWDIERSSIDLLIGQFKSPFEPLRDEEVRLGDEFNGEFVGESMGSIFNSGSDT